MKQLIWKAIKSSFNLYDFTMCDFKADSLEEIKYKSNLVTTIQIGTLIIFMVILFGVTGLIIIN